MGELSIPASSSTFLSVGATPEKAKEGLGTIWGETGYSVGSFAQDPNTYVWAQSFYEFDLSALAGKQVSSCRLRVVRGQSPNFVEKDVELKVWTGAPAFVPHSQLPAHDYVLATGSSILVLGLPVPSRLFVFLRGPTFPPAPGDGAWITEAWLDVTYEDSGGGGGAAGGSLLDLAKAWTLNDDGELVVAPTSLSVSLKDPSGTERTPRVPASFTVSSNTAVLSGVVSFGQAAQAFTAAKVSLWDDLGRELVSVTIPQAQVNAGDEPKLTAMSINLTALDVGNRVLRCVFEGVPVSTLFPDIGASQRVRTLVFRGQLGLEVVAPASMLFLNAANTAQAYSGPNTTGQLVQVLRVELNSSDGLQLWSKQVALTLGTGARVSIAPGALHA